jgi:hypothetical protein
MEALRNPQELAEYLEEKHGVALWRRSWVTPASKSKTNKKEYHYEFPAMSSEDIKGKSNGRGYTNQPKQHSDSYMAISIYLKYVENLYVVDFDDKDKCNERNEFWDYCRGEKSIQIDTTGGSHFYFYIENVPEYTCSTKIQKSDEYGDVDLVGRKKKGMFNIVECWEHPIVPVVGGGYANEIKVLDWKMFEPYLSYEKMCQKPPSKKDKGGTKSQKMQNNAINGDLSKLDDNKFQGYLDRLDKVERYHYEDWFKVGCICFNNWEDKDMGLSKWISWTKEDPNFSAEHPHRSIAYCSQKWETMGDSKTPSTWKTLRGMANIDDPSINQFQELYDVGGENAVVDYMNEFLFFNRNTSEVIMIDPEDETDLAKFECKKTEDLVKNYKKFWYWYEDDSGKKKKMNPFKAWESSIRQLQVARIVFDPGPNVPRNVFNIWRGFEVEEQDVESISLPEAYVECGALIQHLQTIWCKGNVEYYQYLMSWFAWIIQKPWEKVGILLVAKSNEGSGKGIVFDFMNYILGGTLYTSIQNMSQILNPKENSLLEGRILINCDEAHWGGNIQDANRMKALITEPTVHIRDLYRKAYEIKNTTAFCLSSNELRATSAREGDRRHFGLQLSDKWAGKQTTDIHRNYFRAISGMKHSGIKRSRYLAFAKILYNWDLANFNVRGPPNTDFIDGQMEMNWTPVQKWYHSILKTGLFSIGSKYKEPKYNPSSGTTDTFDERILEWGFIMNNEKNGYKKVVNRYRSLDKLVLTFGGICMKSSDNMNSQAYMVWRKFLDDAGLGDTPEHIPVPKSVLDSIYWKGVPTMSREICMDDIKGKRKNQLEYEYEGDTHSPSIEMCHNNVEVVDTNDGGEKGVDMFWFSWMDKTLYTDEDSIPDGASSFPRDDTKNPVCGGDDPIALHQYISEFEDYPLIVKSDWKDTKGGTVHYYEEINEVMCHYYERDWFFDMYKKNEGLGYGSGNPDVGMFWNEIKTLMGGTIEEGGLFSHTRKSMPLGGQTVRRQLQTIPTLESARIKFEKWTGRAVNWEGDGFVLDTGDMVDEHMGDEDW